MELSAPSKVRHIGERLLHARRGYTLPACLGKPLDHQQPQADRRQGQSGAMVGDGFEGIEERIGPLVEIGRSTLADRAV